MDTQTRIFQAVSYLAYPVLVVMVYYALQPFLKGYELFSNEYWESINLMLLFAGLGVSLSTLQDTKRTQNKLSAKVWSDPKKGTIALYLMLSYSILFIGLGIFGIWIGEDSAIATLSYGLLALGIACLGMLKAASQMFAYHRSDKSAS